MPALVLGLARAAALVALVGFGASCKEDLEVEIKDAAAARTLRARLIKQVWPAGSFPARMPDDVQRGVELEALEPLGALARVDRLEVRLPHEMRSVAYLLHPTTGGDELVIYHQGHRGSWLLGRHTVSFFLARGYAVLALSMPLVGRENVPRPELAVRPPRLHDPVEELASEDFHPLSLFLEPVAVALNHALQHGDYERVSMLGISGGAWTTHAYAALDPRVTRSYPVAGSLPRKLRAERESGDYEHRAPDFYEIAGFKELYALGAFGEGRRQMQILNAHDPCCYAAAGREGEIRTYEEQVRKALSRLGSGSFEVFIDTSHRRHQISLFAHDLIASNLQR